MHLLLHWGSRVIIIVFAILTSSLHISFSPSSLRMSLFFTSPERTESTHDNTILHIFELQRVFTGENVNVSLDCATLASICDESCKSVCPNIKIWGARGLKQTVSVPVYSFCYLVFGVSQMVRGTKK